MARVRFLLAFLVVGLPMDVAAQTIQLPVTADNSIIDVNGERDFNMGKTTALRLKSFQHHLILKFDHTALAGKTVTKAWLRYAPRDFLLNRVTLSTIQSDWGEGDSPGFAESVGGSTFNHAFHGAAPEDSVPWAWHGSQFPDVVYGNSHALMNESGCPVVEGRYEWEVGVDLVHANAVGAAYGLTVFESEHDVSRNPTVESLESGKLAPFLEVELGPAEDAPADFGEVDDLTSAEGERGEVLLSFQVPDKAFAYHVLVNGAPLDRYQVPFAGPAGTKQQLRIRDVLSPGEAVQVELTAVNRSGQTNSPAVVDVVADDGEPLPLADYSPEGPDDAGSGPVEGGGLRVWAAPETDKILPDGSFLEDVPDGYRYTNGRFSGGAVRVRGARGETVAFLLALEAVDSPVEGLEVAVDPPEDIQVRVQAVQSVSTSVGPVPEVLVGPEGTGLGPSLAGLATNGDAGAPGASVQLVLVELDIPTSAPQGACEGTISVSGQEVDLQVPLALEVLGFQLPPAPTFFLELNTYGWPLYYATHLSIRRLVRRFRVHVNCVPYGHSGRTRMDMIKPDGSLMDEDGYNAFQAGDTTGNWEPDFLWAFEPLFSGSAWTAPDYEGPGKGLPLSQYYLTFHENWPLPMEEHWNGNMDAFAGFPDIYGQTYTAILADFGKLAQEQGWSHTGFQVYLNNKPGPNNPTPWSLDEPASLWDFKALAYFGTLFQAANLDDSAPNVVYRADISRPQYHRGHLETVQLYVCNFGVCRLFARTISDRQQGEPGFELWTYGTANTVAGSNHHVQSWAARTFAMGGNGILPWQSVGHGPQFLTGADDGQQALALVIQEEDSQNPRVWGTLRLAAYRRAQQDMEYLRLAEQHPDGGYTRGQMARLVGAYLDPEETVDTGHQFAHYAATLPGSGHTEAAFDALRDHAAGILAEESSTPVEGEGGDAGGGTEDVRDGIDGGAVDFGDHDFAERSGEYEILGEPGTECDPATRGASGEGEACTKTADCLCGLSCLPDGDFLLCTASGDDAPGGDSGCGCRLTGTPSAGTPSLLLALLLLGLTLRQRSRNSRMPGM